MVMFSLGEKRDQPFVFQAWSGPVGPRPVHRMAAMTAGSSLLSAARATGHVPMHGHARAGTACILCYAISFDR